MGIEVALSQVALNTQTTVDFTSTKLSAAPVGVFAFIGDGGSNGTANADWRMGYGFTDGTTDVGQISRADSGGSSEDVARLQNTGWVCARYNNLSDQLSHNSFLTDGWRANLDNPGDFGKLALACMFGGSDVTVETGSSAIGDGTQQTVSLSNTNLTPNVILFTGAGKSDGAVGSAFFVPTFGIAHDNGTSIDQRCWRMNIPDGATEGDPRQIIDTGAAFGEENNYTATVDSMSAGQFKFTASADAGSDDIHWIALQIDNANIALVDTDKPTTTGLNEQTEPGFTPKFVLELSTMLTALDTRAIDASAGVVNFSLFNDTEAFSYSWADEDASATIDNQSLTHNKAVYYAADDGSLAFDGSFDSFTANGWKINYSTVDGTTRKGFALAIGEASTGTPVNVDINAGTLTLTGKSHTVSHGQSVDLVAGTLSFAGQGHTVAAGHSDAIGAGALSFTGQSQDVAAGASVDAGAGTLSFSGQSLAITQGTSAAIGAGTLNLTGKSLSVTTGASAAVSVDIQPGTLALTGRSPGLAHGHSLDAGAATLTLAGLAQQIAAGASVDVQAGALTLTGTNAETRAGVAIEVSPGSITLSGSTAETTRGQRLDLGAGTLTLTGQSLSVVVAAIETPDGRTLTIPLDARTLTIEADERTLEIPADVRTLTIH